MTLSIIVPVYNAEKYLDECVRSILNQTFADFELILVDDGSSDNCPEMCDGWAKKDSRIKVIHKENGGPSMARQSGIRAASGDFLAFVDSDDKIDSDMYEAMLKAQKEKDYDYVICGLKRFYNDSKYVRSEPAGDYSLNNSKDILNKLIFPMIYPLDDEHFVSQSTTKNIFKKKIFTDNGIEYRSTDDYFSEDLLLNIEYLMCCERAISIPNTYYNYRANFNSFSQTIRADEKKLMSLINMYYFILELFRNNSQVKIRNSIKTLELLSVYLRHLVKNTGFFASVSRIREICANNDIQKIVDFNYSKLSMKNRIMKILIKGGHSIILTVLITFYNIIYLHK